MAVCGTDDPERLVRRMMGRYRRGRIDVRYTYKEKTYEVWAGINECPDEVDDEVLKIKMPDGTWVEGVSYRPMETWKNLDTGKTRMTRSWDVLYIRSKEDFLSKFTKVEETEE